MVFCLISAATVNDYKDKDELANDQHQRVPLGLLSLASILEQIGITPKIFDLDRIYSTWLVKKDNADVISDFAFYVASILSIEDTEFYGFSSICSSFPLTLRIVEKLKQLRPEVFTILGGPEASANADETLQAFPSVDIIVRGEGEIILPLLISEITSSKDLKNVPGINYRSGESYVRNPDASVIEELESLPLPAFHLYPILHQSAYIPFEIGRGCPFSCKFCSTSNFFRNRFRLKPVEVAIQQMLSLQQTHNISKFDLIHDNFTVDRKRVVQFCEALIDSDVEFTWSCSARPDSLEDDLINLMQSVGCRGFFLGIETGSSRMQKIIGKNLNLKKVKTHIRSLDLQKIESAAAFITGFPEETRKDLRDTVNFFIDMLCYDNIDPQITLLSPLAGTKIYQQHKSKLIFDDIISDMSFQGLEQDAHEREMIIAHPEVFSSFYSVPTPHLDRKYLNELRHFLLNARFDMRWLVVAVRHASGDILTAFDAWQSWRATYGDSKAFHCISTYYSGLVFRQEFTTFVKTAFIKMYPRLAHVLIALCDYYNNLRTEVCDNPLHSEPIESAWTLKDKNVRPILASNVRATRLSVDFKDLISCLREGGELSLIPRRKVIIITSSSEGRLKINQLSSHSAKLLSLCDGTNDVAEIINKFKIWKPKIQGVSSEKAAMVGLEILKKQGFIEALQPKNIVVKAKTGSTTIKNTL